MRTYTLAQLKRDCKSKTIKAEMVIRCGTTDIPEKLRGIRPLVNSNSVAIFFLNSDGRESEMQIKRAKLVEYTEDTLTIFYPAKRPLNEKEQKVMDGWEKISSLAEYKQRAEIDVLTDGSSTYYQEKAYFEKSECPYLFGFEESCGCKYDINSKKVIDYSLQSNDIEMQYKLYRNQDGGRIVIDYARLIEFEFEHELTETAYGEPQVWITLKSGRSIEITHEEEGLAEEEQFYSVRLHCSDDEFDNDDFHSTCGIIDSYIADGTIQIANQITVILSCNNEELSQSEIDFYNECEV